MFEINTARLTVLPFSSIFFKTVQFYQMCVPRLCSASGRPRPTHSERRRSLLHLGVDGNLWKMYEDNMEIRYGQSMKNSVLKRFKLFLFSSCQVKPTGGNVMLELLACKVCHVHLLNIS